MLKIRYFISFIVLSILIIGCNPKTSDLIVTKIGDNKITLGEYEKFYLRNTGGIEAAKNSTMAEREEFLNLLIKYKLKLHDAYDKGLINDPEIIQELNEYKGSLSSTYLLEKDLIEPSLKKLYERSREEIRASHILIRVDMNTSPEDTLIAYNKALEAINRLNKGEDFGELAVEYSEDPSVAQNRGDIYYFTAGQLVPQFEDAVYNMKVGDVSTKPVRTAFGYHIIKVTDRKPAAGTIRVRHIMTRFNSPQPDSADSASAYSRIEAVQDSLISGEDFHAIAVKFSEDGGSAMNGGDLGYFSRRRWIQPFDEAAFKLKVGELSDIIRSPYGYHLIKCEDIKPVKSFDEMKPDLQRIFQSQYHNDAYSKFISDLKAKHAYFFDENVFDNFLSYLDSTQTTSDSAWDQSVPVESRELVLFKIGNANYKLDTIITMLSNRQDFRNVVLKKSDLTSRVDKIGEILLLEESSRDLDTRYPEFGSLMREYQDGVVLYKAEQLEVWNKLAVNDSVLQEYFNTNREKFSFPDRVDISEINVSSDSLAQEIYSMLQNGKDFSELSDEFNEDQELKNKKSGTGLLDVEETELTEMAWEMEVGTVSQPIMMDDGTYSLIKLNAKEPARYKTYEEAGVEVSNSFQEYEQKRLEKEWLNRVESKYPVQKFPEVLIKAFDYQIK